jgi:hypothetical protein
LTSKMNVHSNLNFLIKHNRTLGMLSTPLMIERSCGRNTLRKVSVNFAVNYILSEKKARGERL